MPGLFFFNKKLDVIIWLNQEMCHFYCLVINGLAEAHPSFFLFNHPSGRSCHDGLFLSIFPIGWHCSCSFRAVGLEMAVVVKVWIWRGSSDGRDSWDLSCRWYEEFDTPKVQPCTNTVRLRKFMNEHFKTEIVWLVCMSSNFTLLLVKFLLNFSCPFP